MLLNCPRPQDQATRVARGMSQDLDGDVRGKDKAPLFLAMYRGWR